MTSRWIVREGSVRGEGRYLDGEDCNWDPSQAKAFQYQCLSSALSDAQTYGGRVVPFVPKGPAVELSAGMMAHDANMGRPVVPRRPRAPSLDVVAWLAVEVAERLPDGFVENVSGLALRVRVHKLCHDLLRIASAPTPAAAPLAARLDADGTAPLLTEAEMDARRAARRRGRADVLGPALAEAVEAWGALPGQTRAEVCRAIREAEHHIDADDVALALLEAAAKGAAK